MIEVKAKVRDLSLLESKRSTINTVNAVSRIIISGKIGIKSFRYKDLVIIFSPIPLLVLVI